MIRVWECSNVRTGALRLSDLMGVVLTTEASYIYLALYSVSVFQGIGKGNLSNTGLEVAKCLPIRHLFYRYVCVYTFPQELIQIDFQGSCSVLDTGERSVLNKVVW